ncbi:hypothetical protein GCM10010517_38010 [Streptosporangium fragile]|uniref:CBM2 domain-containing protein n=1 Tax=Streptosporangium fragile TaxID=46186 RepID=A0ABN3VYJ8_9ACTN
MPLTRKIAPLLGLVSLGAALALVAAACVARTPGSGHTAAHASSPAARHAAPAATSPAAGGGVSPAARAAGATSPAGSPAHRGVALAPRLATVTVVESWPGGYRGAATITNRTGQPMRDWYIQWMMPLGTTITQAWNGTPMQSGPVGMIHAPAEKPSLPAGAAVSDIGFVGAARTPPDFTEVRCG